MPLTYKCLFVKKTKMIISLIGFMGCGKSSVGRSLSELLCCPFIDLDDVIEEREGRTITEIFAEDGEAGFRNLELKVLDNIVCKESARQWASPISSTKETSKSDLQTLYGTAASERMGVLALGGGTVMTPQCAELVKEKTLCIYLRASVNTLMERLVSKTESRPLLCQNISSSMPAEEAEEARRNHEAEQPDLLLRNCIEALLAERSATYENTASIIIDTDGKSISAIANEILANC